MKPSYLTSSELSELVGCKPTSYACMRRWLEKNGWAYALNRIGFPQVSREYHDKKLSGITAQQNAIIEPNFLALSA